MTTVLADTKLQADFDKAGYVTVPMLDADQVAALVAEIGTLRPADGFEPDGSSIAKNSFHATFIDTDIAYKHAVFDLLSRHLGHVVDRYLADHVIFMCNVHVKPPGRGELIVHQNWPLFSNHNETSVTIWCPLVDVDVRNGTLHVIPGSHKLLPHVEGPNSPAYFTPFLDRIYDHMKPLPTKAGCGVIFDDGLVHGSPANHSEMPRIAIQVICVPTGSKPVYFFKDGDTRFELVDIDPNFFLDNQITDLLTRKPEWRVSGRVASHNRQLDEAEFLALLAQGDEIRQRGLESVALPSELPLRSGLRNQLGTLRRRGRSMAARLVPDNLKPVIRYLIGRAPTRVAGPSPIRDARQPSAVHITDQVRSYYEEMTPAYISGFGEIFQGSRPESNEALIDYLIDAAALDDGMHLLDAGCGVSGPAIAIAKRKAVTIDGVTLAEAQVKEAERRIADNGLTGRITVQQGDFHALDSLYPAASFDRVLFLESLCHAENYRMVLAAAQRVLKPGGALYIKDFYCVDNRARPSKAKGQLEDLGKLNRLYRLQVPDLASVVDLLSSLGFVIKYMRLPDYEPTYRHWAAYEQIAGRAWAPSSGEPGDIIQAVEFFCWKR